LCAKGQNDKKLISACKGRTLELQRAYWGVVWNCVTVFLSLVSLGVQFDDWWIVTQICFERVPCACRHLLQTICYGLEFSVVACRHLLQIICYGLEFSVVTQLDCMGGKGMNKSEHGHAW
jgi:hypothetical protein